MNFPRKYSVNLKKNIISKALKGVSSHGMTHKKHIDQSCKQMVYKKGISSIKKLFTSYNCLVFLAGFCHFKDIPT